MGPGGVPACCSLPTSLRWGHGPASGRHLEMPGPGGRAGPAPHCPRSPQGCLQGVAATVGREDTWPGMTFAPARAGCSPHPPPPRPVAPTAPGLPRSVISPPSEQLVLPGKLPNESTMRGLWRRNGSGVGLSPSAGPTGHRGHLRSSRAPAPSSSHRFTPLAP